MARTPARLVTPGAFAAAAGAAAAYLLDPRMGRTRRAQLADRTRGMLRRGARKTSDRARKQAERAQDRARGLAREVARDEADLVPDNDQTLIDKIRSEILGAERWRPFTINVDAADGEVALRGQLDRPDQIRDLTDAVGKVPGVKAVRSYLHLPGTEPPNVADARKAGMRPS